MPAGQRVPGVSVVIPCYRQAEYLPFAVASVVLQTHQDWEIVVVDDGSPDDTARVARRLAHDVPAGRLRLVRQENRGLSEARNAGIRAARAPLVLPLDADDALEKTFLERTVAALRDDASASIAGTDGFTFGAVSALIEQPRPWNVDWLRQQNAFACCCLFRREVWEAVGGYNPNMTAGYEDWDLWLGACERGFKAAYVPEPLFLYRTKQDSMASGAVPLHRSLLARIALNHPASFGEAERREAEAQLEREPLPVARPAVVPELGARRDWAHPPAQAGAGAPRRNLVVCRVGDRSVHRTWLGSPAARSYDVWLDHEGTDTAAHQGEPARLSAGPGPRWARLGRLLAERCAELAGYEAIFLPGDDVVLSPAGVEALFERFHASGATLAEPAHARGSAHGGTAWEAEEGGVRAVRAVGDEAPLFSRAALAACAPTFGRGGPEAWPALAGGGAVVIGGVGARRTFAGDDFAQRLEVRQDRPRLPARATSPAVPVRGAAAFLEALRSAVTLPAAADAPRVSVVIPCYRQAEYLKFAVSSVALQRYHDWEIVIVDDGSPDDTARVAEDLIAAMSGKRIRLLRQANAGLATARNNGIRAARGRYILPLDSDDGLADAFLERTVAVLDGDPHAQVVATDAYFFGHQQRVNKAFPLAPLETIIRRNVFHYASLYRREVWERVGGYNPNLTVGYEDWDFWVGVKEEGFVVRHVKEPLFLYRTKAESMITRAQRWHSSLYARIALNHPRAFPGYALAQAEQILREHPLPRHGEPDPVPLARAVNG